MTTLNQQQEQLRQGIKSDPSAATTPGALDQQPTREQLLSSSNLPGGPMMASAAAPPGSGSVDDNSAGAPGMKPSVTPKETAMPALSEKQKDVVEQQKGTSGSGPTASTTAVSTSKPQTTTMIGQNGEKIVVGDDFIQITYDNKNIDTSTPPAAAATSGGEKKDAAGVGVGEAANIVLDGEASATLAEATSEIAAASSDASTQLSLGDESAPLLTNISDVLSSLNDEEKSLLQRLMKLNNEVNERTSSMERLTKKLADHIIRLISLSWNTNRAPTMVSLPLFGLGAIEEMMEQNINMASKYSLLTGANAARTMSDKMEAEAKATREWLVLQFGEVTAFTNSSNEVVRQRGGEFKKKLEALIQTCDRIMNRAKHAATSFTHFLQRRVPLPSIEQVTKPTGQQTRSTTSSRRESKEALASPATPSTDDTKGTTMTAQATPAVPEKVRVRWSPDFLSRELLDGVLITSTLPGLTSDNLTINVDDQLRILHICGQRTVKQRVIDHEATASASPFQYNYDDEDEYEDLFDLGFRSFFGRNRRLVPQHAITKVVEVEQWFDEKLQLPSWLSTNIDKYRTSIDTKTGHFSIAIPKVADESDQQGSVVVGRQTIPVTRKDSSSMSSTVPASASASSTSSRTSEPSSLPSSSLSSLAGFDESGRQQRRRAAAVAAARNRRDQLPPPSLPAAGPVWSYYGVDDPFYDDPWYIGGGGYRHGLGSGGARYWPFNTPLGFGW